MMGRDAREEDGDHDDGSDLIRRDRWAGAHMDRGARPVVPTYTLPTASHDYDATFFQIAAASGTPSILYWGAVDAAGDPEWVVVATGTP